MKCLEVVTGGGAVIKLDESMIAFVLKLWRFFLWKKGLFGARDPFPYVRP